MGYTHYWQFKKSNNKRMPELEKALQKAVDEIGLVARTWQKMHPKGSIGDACRLSGYTAHVKPGQGYRGIKLNGKGDNSHEDFCIREHFRQNLDQGFNFCKTARKPYDTVIIAALCILKHRLGDAIEVSSDGDAAEWNEGLALARKVTRLAIKNPLGTGLKLIA